MWYTAFLDQGMPFPLGDLPLSVLVSICSSFATPRRFCCSICCCPLYLIPFRTYYLSGPAFSVPGSMHLYCMQLLPYSGAPELLNQYAFCSTMAVQRVCRVFELRYQQSLPPVCC